MDGSLCAWILASSCVQSKGTTDAGQFSARLIVSNQRCGKVAREAALQPSPAMHRAALNKALELSGLSFLHLKNEQLKPNRSFSAQRNGNSFIKKITIHQYLVTKMVSKVKSLSLHFL